MAIWDEFKKIFGVAPVSMDQLNRAALKVPPRTQPIIHTIPNIEITPEYKQILDWLNAGAPMVFVTGKAGTGKTTLVQYLRSKFQANTVVVAPTGVAALNVGGTTIHSFFRFPPHLITVRDIKFGRDRKLYTKMRLLIIDEISMVRVDVIDGMDRFLRMIRQNDQPFGGVQVLMIGDLFQLPPVVPQPEQAALEEMGYQSPWFFSANAFKECAIMPIELTKVYRQSEAAFIGLLNKVRIAEDIDGLLPIVNRRCLPVSQSDGLFITLTCTNKVADEINDQQLKKLQTPAQTFVGEVRGKFIIEHDKLPSPINLTLKAGAQVMFTKKDEKGCRWVNGTLGKVVEIANGIIRVEVDGAYAKATYDVSLAKWESYKYVYDEELDAIIAVTTGYYLQYPLMLAWAVTIHKSQGKTLEKVRIDLGHGAFDSGQVYVALSRCRTLDNVFLTKPIQKQDIKCAPIIKRFYAALFPGQER